MRAWSGSWSYTHRKKNCCGWRLGWNWNLTTLRGTVLGERGFDLVATVWGRECILFHSSFVGFLWIVYANINIGWLSRGREFEALVPMCCHYRGIPTTWPNIEASLFILSSNVLWFAPLGILLLHLLILVEFGRSLGRGWSFRDRAIRVMCERHHGFPMPQGVSADTPQGRFPW
jgi:hypothetical protein